MSHTPIFLRKMMLLPCPRRPSSGKKIAKEQNLFALSLQKSLEKGIWGKNFSERFFPVLTLLLLKCHIERGRAGAGLCQDQV